MRLRIFSNYNSDIERRPIEIVERKGIGHPDTLADLIADQLSNKYSLYCSQKFGVIPNHWADKITIVGGKSMIVFGHSVVVRPIKIFQFGRMTLNIGDIDIDVDQLFQEAVGEIFGRVFLNTEILNYTLCEAIVHSGTGPDHFKEFYDPQSPMDVIRTRAIPRANDTAVITAYAGYSKAEILAIELENYLNSEVFKLCFPETGWDIKVFILREKNNFDVTVCIPFIASRTSNLQFYRERLDIIYNKVLNIIRENFCDIEVSIHLNTKDNEDRTYLTAFGTSADKGDCGAVGRGNRYNGIIVPCREMSIEAPSGKILHAMQVKFTVKLLFASLATYIFIVV